MSIELSLDIPPHPNPLPQGGNLLKFQRSVIGSDKKQQNFYT
jgi:hypothetical protein